jgi:filamentous hemagglutinin
MSAGEIGPTVGTFFAGSVFSASRMPRITPSSTGRTLAFNLEEQLAMEAAQADSQAGTHITRIVLNDSRWSASEGWVKMRQNINGVEIHYVRNTITGAVDDFKFK